MKKGKRKKVKGKNGQTEIKEKGIKGKNGQTEIKEKGKRQKEKTDRPGSRKKVT